MGCCQSAAVTPTSGETVIDRRPRKSTSSLSSSRVSFGRKNKPKVDDEELREVVQWKNTVDGLLRKTHLRNYALSRTSKQLGSLAALKEFLRQSPAADQLEQVWVIYCWVTHNISYDAYGYQRNQKGPQDPESVFRSGLSVCEGYASMMLSCCTDLGITCRKISGYSKGFGFKQGDTFKETDHAWNAVKLEGETRWRLVESTWGAGSMSESYTFKRSFDPYYFSVPPHVLIATHFCEEFQPQRRQLTLQQFERRSPLKKFYYMSCLNCVSHDVEEGVVSLKEQTATFVFEVPNANDNQHLRARLEHPDGKEIEDTVLVQKRGRCYELTVVLPEVQNIYNVQLFKSIENVESSDLGHFQVQCVGSKKLGSDEILLCHSYSASEKVYLVSPRRAALSALRTEHFSIWVEGAAEVVLIDEGKCFHRFELSKSKEEPPNPGQKLWTLDHFFDVTGKYSLSIKYSKEAVSYSTLFQYDVSIENVRAKSSKKAPTDFTTPVLRCLSHNNIRVSSSESPVVMTFQSTKSVNVMVSLQDEKDNKIEDAVLAQRTRIGKDGYQLTISAILPRSEKVFTLSIFYNYGESNTYHQYRNYSLQWTAKNQQDVRHYCKLSTPRHGEVYLFEPLWKELKVSQPQNFKIQVSAAIDVAIVDSAKNWFHFKQKESDQKSAVWTYEQFVPKIKGACDIFAKFNENESFFMVCSYTVI